MLEKPTPQDKRWQDWCDAFLAASKKPMTTKNSEDFFKLTMMDMKPEPDEELESYIQQSESFQIKVAYAHARRIGLNMSAPLCLLLCSITESAGELVMYVHAMRRVQQRHDLDRVRISHFAAPDVFGFGLPTSEAMESLWDAQKTKAMEIAGGLYGTGDNYLDYIHQP